MKKLIMNYGAILTVSLMIASCNGGRPESKESKDSLTHGTMESKSEEKWSKLAELNGLTKDDVVKAIAIGTKMSECYQLETAPGKMDSKMTQDCDPFVQEYKDYCAKNFGTEEITNGTAKDNSPGMKKLEAFREIMFSTRNSLTKSKAK